ncbi:MAG: hypothetical protein K1X89_14930 [Myxococcaceae bacterium]|nr:hypothetical protein [Myxococcaceae bacterium]
MKSQGPAPEFRFSLAEVLEALPPELQAELKKLDPVETEFLLHGKQDEKAAYAKLSPDEQKRFAWLPPSRRAQEVQSAAQGPSRFTAAVRPKVVLDLPALGAPQPVTAPAAPASALPEPRPAGARPAVVQKGLNLRALLMPAPTGRVAGATSAPTLPTHQLAALESPLGQHPRAAAALEHALQLRAFAPAPELPALSEGPAPLQPGEGPTVPEAPVRPLGAREVPLEKALHLRALERREAVAPAPRRSTGPRSRQRPSRLGERMALLFRGGVLKG